MREQLSWAEVVLTLHLDIERYGRPGVGDRVDAWTCTNLSRPNSLSTQTYHEHSQTKGAIFEFEEWKGHDALK